MVKKKTTRQKVKDKANKDASAASDEKDVSTPEEESKIGSISHYEQLPQNVKRKILKQARFYAKLQETQRALSATGSIGKKKNQGKRNKSSQAWKDLSCLVESLPTVFDPKSVPQTTENHKLNCKSRQKLVVQETKQFEAVLTHPVFNSDPFSAIEQHLSNSLGPQNNKVKRKPGKKEKPSKKKKKRSKASLPGTVQAMEL